MSKLGSRHSVSTVVDISLLSYHRYRSIWHGWKDAPLSYNGMSCEETSQMTIDGIHFILTGMNVCSFVAQRGEGSLNVALTWTASARSWRIPRRYPFHRHLHIGPATRVRNCSSPI